jgi:hypothetical protein
MKVLKNLSPEPGARITCQLTQELPMSRFEKIRCVKTKANILFEGAYSQSAFITLDVLLLDLNCINIHVDI